MVTCLLLLGASSQHVLISYLLNFMYVAISDVLTISDVFKKKFWNVTFAWRNRRWG